MKHGQLLSNDILQQYNYTTPSTIALNCVKAAEILLDLLGGEAVWNCASSKNGQVLQNEGVFLYIQCQIHISLVLATWSADYPFHTVLIYKQKPEWAFARS